MSDYTKTTDFAAKDALASGNAAKIVKGTEIDTEFDNIATAVATKYDSNDRGAANGIAPLDSSSLVPVANLPDATTSADGVVELATNAETLTGTATNRAVTPAGVQAVLDQAAGMLEDIANITDPGADRILFWDESNDDVRLLSAGTGLAIDGQTMNTDDSAIVHDDLSGFVAEEHIDHTAVTLTAGTGLSGGGDISDNRTFNLDISGLTSISISGLVSADGFLVDDGGTMKRIAKQDIGVQISTETTNSTYDLTDANQMHVLTDAAMTVTIPPNASVAYPVGTCIYFAVDGTGTITLDPGSGVTFNSIIAQASTADRFVLPGGMAALVKVATNEWNLSGDIS